MPNEVHVHVHTNGHYVYTNIHVGIAHKCFFHDPQGHPYDYFAWGWMYMYIYLYVFVIYVVNEVALFQGAQSINRHAQGTDQQEESCL